MTTQLSVDHVNYLISLANRVPFPDIFDDDVRSVLAHES